MKIPRKNIRNFCIIAHIDHGKSTLADRFIQKTKIISNRNFHDQMLDTMDIERERGITIKSQAVTIPFINKNNQVYSLNLVDTPGHVDFSYEVSRAIASCEGALLLIDASQGVEAQTLANMYMALEYNLEIIPVINKIDLPGADIEAVRHQIKYDLGLDEKAAVLISAKTGEGIDRLLEAVIEHIPPPKDNNKEALKALIFDSYYDPYRGVIVHIRLFQGSLKEGQLVRFWSTKAVYKVEETGYFKIELEKTKELYAGDVGYFIAGIKNISDVRVGDTVTDENNICDTPLSGFKEAKPVVFSSLYPVDSDDYEELQIVLDKLKLNDASLVFEKDSSVALGFGFRCGFLGLLHLEVIQERIEREYGLSIILTAPSVKYRLTMNNEEVFYLDNPVEFPDPSTISMTEEPYIEAAVITPSKYLGSIINLCLEKRGVQKNMIYLDEKRIEIRYEMPLAEVLFDFYDKLKSISRGYASFDYEIIDYKPTDLVKLDILLNANIVDALSQLVFKDNAYNKARDVCRKLKEEIPKHQFKVPIQGAINSTIIARETVSAIRKDVTAKCYGGDISRKRKLLEKQKKGKKRMKLVGNVELPQSAFISILKTD